MTDITIKYPDGTREDINDEKAVAEKTNNKNAVCKHCKTRRLQWRKDGSRWRLYDNVLNQWHVCQG